MLQSGCHLCLGQEPSTKVGPRLADRNEGPIAIPAEAPAVFRVAPCRALEIFPFPPVHLSKYLLQPSLLFEIQFLAAITNARE